MVVQNTQSPDIDSDDRRQELALATPHDFNQRQISIIRATVANGASDDEFAFFLEVCRATGLNPLLRQIHCVMRNQREGDKWVKRMTIQTGIDGYRLLAHRTGTLAGIEDAIFDVEDADHPGKATVTVWRFINGPKVAFTASARWREYAQFDKDGKPQSMWAKMPYHMLAKCAESLALRKAFQGEMSGVYTDDEMMQAENPRFVDADPAPATSANPDYTRVSALCKELKVSAQGKRELMEQYHGDPARIEDHLLARKRAWQNMTSTAVTAAAEVESEPEATFTIEEQAVTPTPLPTIEQLRIRANQMRYSAEQWEALIAQTHGDPAKIKEALDNNYAIDLHALGTAKGVH